MNAYLPKALPLAPTTFRRLIWAIPASRHDEVLEEGRFSPREVIAHMADWEPIIRGRIKTGVESPGSTIEVFDEEEMAERKNYRGSSIDEQLRIFERERAVTGDYIKGLSKEDMAKALNHPELGAMTVGDLANMLIGHDSYHFEQLSAYLEGRSAGTW